MKSLKLTAHLAKRNKDKRTSTFVLNSVEMPISALAELSERLSRQIELSFDEVKSLDQVIKVLHPDQAALVVAGIQNQADIEKMLSFFSSQKERFFDGSLKMILLDDLNESFASSILRMRGNVETLPTRVSSKELNFRVRMNLNLLEHRNTQIPLPLAEVDPTDKKATVNLNKLSRELKLVENTFENLCLEVKSKNRFSNEEQKDVTIRLIEVQELNCTLEIPEYLLENTELVLDFSTVDTPTHAVVSFRLEIAQVLGSAGGRSVVIVKLTEDFAIKLKSIVKQFELRRESLMGFFTAGKLGAS